MYPSFCYECGREVANKSIAYQHRRVCKSTSTGSLSDMRRELELRLCIQQYYNLVDDHDKYVMRAYVFPLFLGNRRGG